MSVTCHDCGIPLPADATGYTACTCVEDAAQARRLVVTVGELDPQPAAWPHEAPACFRVEWDPKLFRVTDSEGGDRTFERPEQALTYSRDRVAGLGGPRGDMWFLMVCLECGTAEPDPNWPAPPHYPSLPGDRFRCHVTGRFAARLTALRASVWAQDVEQARRVFARLRHRDDCSCYGCIAAAPCDAGCHKCHPDLPQEERAARRRRHSAVPSLGRRGDWL